MPKSKKLTPLISGQQTLTKKEILNNNLLTKCQNHETVCWNEHNVNRSQITIIKLKKSDVDGQQKFHQRC